MSFENKYDEEEYEEYGEEYLYEEEENMSKNVSKDVSKEKKTGIFTPSPVIVMSEKKRKSIGDDGIVILGRKSSGSISLEKTLNLRKTSITSIPEQRRSSWASPSIPTPSLKKIMNQQELPKTPVKGKKEITTCPTVPKKTTRKSKFKGTPMELDWGSSSIKVPTLTPNRKMRMCRYFKKYGKCNRNYCTFAHSEEELGTEIKERINDSYCVPEKINDPIEFSKSLEKTKMCRNIARYGNCTRDVCTYAHSLEELRPKKCIFGDECKYIDSKTRSCRYIHPFEDLSQYAERTGYKEPNPEHIYSPIQLPIPVKKISKEVVSPCKKQNVENTYANVTKCKKEERQETDCFEITMYGYKIPLELANFTPMYTITCPKEFVEGIISLVFARGMRNIRINSI